MSFLNSKRLRDYPRLMLFAVWSILGINIFLHQGWIGAFGQIIGGDFIMFYSTGVINRTNPQMIYDYDTQMLMQQGLIAPTALPGYNPYMNPPFVAPAYSLLTYLSLKWAMIAWTILSIAAVFISMYLLYRLFLLKPVDPVISYGQLVIVALSFFPFIEGLLAGQNHWMTLLLVSGIIYAMFKEKWCLAGACAGLLIFKPQFALGFIVIWLIWKNFKALLSFVLVTITWMGIFVLKYGFDLFISYFHLNQVFMQLPYIAGFPKYLVVTMYGLLTSIFPQNIQPILSTTSQVLFALCIIILAWLAFKCRKEVMVERIPVITLALLIPLLASPYALLHDMVILIPAFVLWSIYSPSRKLLYTAVIVYLGLFIFTFVGALTKLAWPSLLNLSLFVLVIGWIITKNKPTVKPKIIL